MTRKPIFAAMLSLFLLTSLTGCNMELGHGIIEELKDHEEGIREEMGELWDGFLMEVNDWADSFATYSITEDRVLVGERKKGIDNYVGTYEAGYSQFTGKEFIFGGVSLKRKEGSDLYATYSLAIRSGEARLYRMDGCDEIILADISDEGIYEFTIHAGKNFIVLEGEQFTGSLALTVESSNPEMEEG